MTEETAAPGPRRVPVDLGELAAALEDDSGFGRWFLDPETGEITYLSDEVQTKLSSLDRALGGELSPDDPVFQAALQARKLPEWEREAVEEAARIDAGFGQRYVAIEPENSSEGYQAGLYRNRFRPAASGAS